MLYYQAKRNSALSVECILCSILETFSLSRIINIIIDCPLCSATDILSQYLLL